MLALFGPTATGKSAIAHALARELDGEVVVADPFQRYRGLEVASDAPSSVQRREVRYHFVGDLGLDEDSSAGSYANEAHAVIDRVVHAGRVPIVAGGTGLYLRAALCEMQMREAPPREVRDWAEALAADPPAAVAELEARDPAAARVVDPANPRRLARALERAATGDDGVAGDIWSAPLRLPTLVVGIDRPRDVVSDLISRRVDREISDGLVWELRAALANPSLSRGPGQVIGMREVRLVDSGELAGDDLPEALAARTRRLARMQRTWMRRIQPDCVIDLGEAPARDAVPRIAALWHSAREGTG